MEENFTFVKTLLVFLSEDLPISFCILLSNIKEKLSLEQITSTFFLLNQAQ